MKKKLSYLIIILLITIAFSGCNNASSEALQNEESDKINILTTTFPQYDWARQIAGENNDNIEISMLVDSGIDLHSFQPSVEDIGRIANCDIFIYTGGESDIWVEDALKVVANHEIISINLVEVLGDDAKKEDVVEGMQHEHADHEESDAHDDHEHEDEEHLHGDEAVMDEHVWLSLKNAQRFTTHISEKLGELDSKNLSLYAENAKKYIEKLDALDSSFESIVSKANKNTLLFGDRFPFRYLVDDYNIKYYAAFAGCSAETEASFETIIFLANKVDELGLNCVIALESSDQSIAKTIIDNTKKKDQSILLLDSIQSINADNIASGISYISIMETNLEVIKKALE